MTARRATRGHFCRIASMLAVLAACDSAPDRPSSTQAPERRVSEPTKDTGRQIRVGNQAKGVEEQPDYDLAATRIRERVGRRLPDPLPSPEVACNSMFDAVVSYYENAERTKETAVAQVQKTRARDFEACKVETSPAAAACVAILSAEEDGEFPALLDQCSRAFPVK